MTPTFTEWRYLWPPRPTAAILPGSFDYLAAQGYGVQLKLNGTCAVIGLGPDGREELWNRHEQPLKWSMPETTRAVLRQMFPGDRWTVIVAELLHSKVKNGPRDLIYIHDILIEGGNDLVGESYRAREDRLMKAAMRVDRVACNRQAWTVTPRVWVARTYSGETAEALFVSMEPGGIEEGIVLKDMSAKLEPCVKQSSNSDWSAKCRYANKNLAF